MDNNNSRDIGGKSNNINSPLTILSWPKAILHVDGDAFFTSCEQALNPSLKGKPIVTGEERGIAACVSYEAKKLGIKRGMRIGEIRKFFPEVKILPSDYETYSLFSLRMFDILRSFSPVVEEYSIDEGFVDITGLRRPYHSSYKDIGIKIKEKIKNELGITVSIGISITKVLSKIASRLRKPDGLTVIPGREIHIYLRKLPISEVWGIGPNTTSYLEKLGITKALEFAKKDEKFIKKHLSKPFFEIWQELNGISIYPVKVESKDSYKSISKAKTFSPPTNDEHFLFGELSKNLEDACLKARKYKLVTSKIIVFLRTQDFRDEAVMLKLTRPSSYPIEILPMAKEGFYLLYKKDRQYRQTGVVLCELVSQDNLQLTLFENPPRIEKSTKLYNAIDKLSRRFGKHIIMHGCSFSSELCIKDGGHQSSAPYRVDNLLIGENKRQKIGIPMLYIK
ncbi:MAG: DNA polymerase IV [Actinobacteria bacterium]|nr:DNA polymerase IV [Actinomycetota bacterium]